MAKANKYLKKEIEKYMKLPYTIKLVPEGDGTYYVSVEELPGCASMGDTVEEASRMIKEAMEGWLESNIERGLEIPLPKIMREYSGKFVLRLPVCLHEKLAREAEKEGVSLNQYVVSLLSERGSLKSIEKRIGEIEQLIKKGTTKHVPTKGENVEVVWVEERGEQWKKGQIITTN